MKIRAQFLEAEKERTISSARLLVRYVKDNRGYLKTQYNVLQALQGLIVSVERLDETEGCSGEW